MLLSVNADLHIFPFHFTSSTFYCRWINEPNYCSHLGENIYMLINNATLFWNKS